ncbi:hypothetical protein AMATHDRAFT_71642 [Amanita thiersii Skay4041]|uniref:Uncharacterized protein n=1 Tax=Amanita thiersii Skay4041 TaxID=703135 RepID=A0A2A9N6S0_9AGAR|nr:hypothetical protein AMATHDRAFT_71642 [Amanita thiersii Skay4041]
MCMRYYSSTFYTPRERFQLAVGQMPWYVYCRMVAARFAVDAVCFLKEPPNF